MSAREAREWLETEYGPDRYVPCKFIHSGQQEASLIKERRKEAGVISIGRRNFLIIEHAYSPQTRMSGGLVCVQWMPGLPPEQPKRGKTISNGWPQDILTESGMESEKLLAAHRCQEL
jgi:hypothetical protein